jgi:hypothetical protein
MKIELDHQELKSILEHLDQDKARLHEKIRLVLEPVAQMAAQLAGDHFSGPQPVPEPSNDDGADEDAEPSTGTGG